MTSSVDPDIYTRWTSSCGVGERCRNRASAKWKNSREMRCPFFSNVCISFSRRCHIVLGAQLRRCCRVFRNITTVIEKLSDWPTEFGKYLFASPISLVVRRIFWLWLVVAQLSPWILVSADFMTFLCVFPFFQLSELPSTREAIRNKVNKKTSSFMRKLMLF